MLLLLLSVPLPCLIFLHTTYHLYYMFIYLCALVNYPHSTVRSVRVGPIFYLFLALSPVPDMYLIHHQYAINVLNE